VRYEKDNRSIETTFSIFGGKIMPIPIIAVTAVAGALGAIVSKGVEKVLTPPPPPPPPKQIKNK
jgi:energy-converting hydrogenase Eha subunit A